VFEAAVKHLETVGAVTAPAAAAAATAGWQLRAAIPSRGIAYTARFYVDDGAGAAPAADASAAAPAGTAVAAVAPSASIVVDVIAEEGPQDVMDEAVAQLFDAVAAAATSHGDAVASALQ